MLMRTGRAVIGARALHALVLLVVFLAGPTCVGSAAGSKQAPFVVHDCPSAWAWFDKEPGYGVTLMAVGAGPGTYAKPTAPDSITMDFSRAMHYYTSFGRGCLGGFYDSSHDVAALYAWHENYDDSVVFFVHRPVAGFTAAMLLSVRTVRGVALGTTMDRVIAIEGHGTRTVTKAGAQLLRYEWRQSMRGSGLTTNFYLTFLFERDRLVAMDYAKRV